MPPRSKAIKGSESFEFNCLQYADACVLVLRAARCCHQPEPARWVSQNGMTQKTQTRSRVRRKHRNNKTTKNDPGLQELPGVVPLVRRFLRPPMLGVLRSPVDRYRHFTPTMIGIQSELALSV